MNSKNTVARSEIITKNDETAELELSFKDYILVVYTKERITTGWAKNTISGQNPASGRSTTELDNPWEFEPDNFQTSYLFLIKNSIVVRKDGTTPTPEYIKEYGFWAGNRVAELLPLEYHPPDN